MIRAQRCPTPRALLWGLALTGCTSEPCAEGYVRGDDGQCEIPADDAFVVPDTGTPAAPHDYAELPTSENVDVLIVGGGPAGLAAAIEALAAGASVRILEREDIVGGSANYASGLMMFSGTPEQASAGILDSPELLTAEWPAFTGGDTTDPWFQTFAAHNVDLVHDWLEGFGLSWLAPGPDPSAGATWRTELTNGGGTALVAALHAQIPEGDIRYGAQVDDLAFDAEGRVIGAAWTDVASGVRSRSLGRATVVATGGFAHNLDRVLRERPELPADKLTYASWQGADGFGLDLLQRNGAATENLAAVGLYAHATYVPDEPHAESGPGPLFESPWVNVHGERFCNESEINSFIVGEARAAQPEGEAWAIFDDESAASFVLTGTEGAEWTVPELVAVGYVTQADSLPELGSALGADPETLAASVQGFNEWVDGATDRYRTEGEPGVSVVTPPFYAIGVATSVAKNFGGISVDLSGRVIDLDGAPIPGLYAAGELTGMLGGSIVGEWGFTGSLSAVVLGGRVAGGGAATEE